MALVPVAEGAGLEAIEHALLGAEVGLGDGMGQLAQEVGLFRGQACQPADASCSER